MFRHITNLWSKASLDELPDGRGEELVVGSGIKIEDVSRKKNLQVVLENQNFWFSGVTQRINT